MAVKISILVENTVGFPAGIVAEWGLAALIDFKDEQFLFDVGAQGSLIGNAQKLGIDLLKVNKVILSHGHYDHTGGLLDFLKFRGPVTIYAHPSLFAPHHERILGRSDAYIGVPYPIEQLEKAGAQFVWQREPWKLRPDLWLSGEIPRQTEFETGDSRLIQKQGENVEADSFMDDLSLFHTTDKGLVIILGCAHAGLVNIVEHARQVTGQEKIRAIIGGTHLGPASKEQQERTIAYLHTLELECLAPNHCTGQAMTARLASEFAERFCWAPAGTTIELD